MAWDKCTYEGLHAQSSPELYLMTCISILKFSIISFVNLWDLFKCEIYGEMNIYMNR